MKHVYTILTLLLTSILYTCCNSYDHDLIHPYGHHTGYTLIELGCLVNGPWLIDDAINVFNTKVFLNDSEIISAPAEYDNYQKDLIFQLHKNGTITYWLKSENRITPDAKVKNGEVVIISKSKYREPPKKFYTTGFWKVNFEDSALLVHFQEKGFPEINFKISQLTSSSAHFQQVLYFDSLYNGNKVKMKKVNTLNYTILYPTL